MIVTHDQSDLQITGNIEKHSVSIDSKNINHIVTILSSNLYSEPQESFLRETVSNAVDSHKEAGCKEPVILTINDKNVAIRDYGTGISPEKFNDIYLNIGSSTKRDSNDYIGHFGIGRFSALSCSSLVNITSFYNGKAYYYVMLRDIDKLSIDKVNEIPTTEANGVEVRIPIDPDKIDKYIEKLHTLSFIPNLYVNATRSDCTEFNSREILTYKTFKYCDYVARHKNGSKVLIGNILYSIEDYKFEQYNSIYDNILKSICPVFNIGELDITPNRESILYSDRTVAIINQRLDEVVAEIEEIINSTYGKDYDNFLEYCYNEVIKTAKDVTIGNRTFTVYRSPVHGTYKGKAMSESELQIAYHIANMDYKAVLIKSGNSISRGERYTNRHLYNQLLKDTYKNSFNASFCRKFLIIPSNKGFSSRYLPGYLDETYPSELVVFTDAYNARKVKTCVNELFFSFGKKIPKSTILHVAHEYLKAIKPYCIYDDVMNSQGYKDYKKEHQELKVTKFSNDVLVYLKKEYVDKKKCSDVKDIIDFAKNKGDKGYIWAYTTTDSPFFYDKNGCAIDFRRYCAHHSILLIAVAKSNVKIFQQLPKRFVPIEDVIKKSVTFNREVTSAFLRQVHPYMYNVEYREQLMELAKCINKEEAEQLKYFLYNYTTETPFNSTDIANEVVVNEDILNSYKVYARYIDVIRNNMRLIGYCSEVNALTAYILYKKGDVRINLKALKEIKQVI